MEASDSRARQFHRVMRCDEAVSRPPAPPGPWCTGGAVCQAASGVVSYRGENGRPCSGRTARPHHLGRKRLKLARPLRAPSARRAGRAARESGGVRSISQLLREPLPPGRGDRRREPNAVQEAVISLQSRQKATDHGRMGAYRKPPTTQSVVRRSLIFCGAPERFSAPIAVLFPSTLPCRPAPPWSPSFTARAPGRCGRGYG